MKNYILSCAIFSLIACADNRDINIEEGVWQSAHLVDVMQTFHGAASDPCYKEGDPVTRFIVGSEPTHAAVAGWGIGFSLIHFGVTTWLTDHDFYDAAGVWEFISIGETGWDLGHNYSIGIRLGRPNTDYWYCPLAGKVK